MIDNTLFAQLLTEHDNPAWVLSHEADLRGSIRRSLVADEAIGNTLEALLLIIPAVFHKPPLLLPWTEILEQVVSRLAVEGPAGSGNWLQLDTSWHRWEYVPDALNPRRTLELFLTLLATQPFTHTLHLSQHYIDGVLYIGRQVKKDQTLINKLYQVLSQILIYQEEYRRGIQFMQMPMSEYAHMGNPEEYARSVHAVGLANTMLGHHREAHCDLEKARQALLKTDNRRQYVVVALQKAWLTMQQPTYESALQWAQIARHEARLLNSVYDEGIALHYEGLALTHLGDYDTAHIRLLDSLFIWRQIANLVQLIALQRSLALLEVRQGQPQYALGRLQAAINLLHNWQDYAWRNNQIAAMQALMEDIGGDQRQDLGA